MMNIPPSAAEELSLWEYEALLYHWNEAHSGGDDAQPPDPELTQRLIDAAKLNPQLTNAPSGNLPATPAPA